MGFVEAIGEAIGKFLNISDAPQQTGDSEKPKETWKTMKALSIVPEGSRNSTKENQNTPKIIEGKTDNYKVFLVLPENKKKYTNLIGFFPRNSQERWYFLEYNKRFYRAEDIEGVEIEKGWAHGNDGRLDSMQTNVIFCDIDDNLSFGQFEFTPKAASEVKNVDKIKLGDWSFVNVVHQIRLRYKMNNLQSIVIMAVIFMLGLALLTMIMFGATGGLLKTEGDVAQTAYITKASPIPFDANNTIIIYNNQTYSGANIRKT
jgi:hypothetical protein